MLPQSFLGEGKKRDSIWNEVNYKILSVFFFFVCVDRVMILRTRCFKFKLEKSEDKRIEAFQRDNCSGQIQN